MKELSFEYLSENKVYLPIRKNCSIVEVERYLIDNGFHYMVVTKPTRYNKQFKNIISNGRKGFKLYVTNNYKILEYVFMLPTENDNMLYDKLVRHMKLIQLDNE